jgi:hypothetical protein
MARKPAAKKTERVEPPPEPPPEQSGVMCPRCGCRHLPVLETRTVKGKIRRRRECRHCGCRITTTEEINPRWVERAIGWLRG